MRDLDIEQGLDKKVKIQGKELTHNEALDIYISSHDKAKMDSMLAGNGLSPAFINEAIGALTAEEKAFGDFLLDFYSDSYEPINRVFREVNFVNLPRNDGYSPMFKDLDFVAEKDINLAKANLEYAKASVSGKERTKLRTGSLTPIRLDAIGNLVNFINRTNHYVAFELASKEMSAILRGLKSAIRQELGIDFHNLLRSWLESVASDGRFVASDLGKALLSLRRGFTKGVLGLNLITAVKQTISMSAFLTEITEPQLAKGVASYWRNKKAWDTFWDTTAPQIAQRGETITRDIASISKQRKAIDKIFRRKGITEKTLGLIRIMDRMTVRGGATAVYKANGGTLGAFSAEALAKTLGVVKRTQPSGLPENLASLQRGSELAKLMTMFQNQPNRYFNIIYHNIRARAKDRTSTGHLARSLLYAWIVPALVFEFMSKGGKSDLESYAKAVGLGPFSFLLAVGNIFQAIRDGFSYDMSPVATIPNDIVRIGQDLMQGEVLDAMFQTAETGALSAGLPVNQPKRTITGLYDLLTGKTDDWRRLIWSKYMLKEKAKKGISIPSIEIPSISIPSIEIPSISF